jgi:hypothetical protein
MLNFTDMAEVAEQTSQGPVVTVSSKVGTVGDIESFNLTLNLEAIKPNEKNFQLTREKLIAQIQSANGPSFLRTNIYLPRGNSGPEVLGQSQVCIRMDKNRMKEEDLPAMGFAQLPMEEQSPHILPKPKRQQAVPSLQSWEAPHNSDAPELQYFIIDIMIPKKRLQADVKSIEAKFSIQLPVKMPKSGVILNRLFKAETLTFKKQ